MTRIYNIAIASQKRKQYRYLHADISILQGDTGEITHTSSLPLVLVHRTLAIRIDHLHPYHQGSKLWMFLMFFKDVMKLLLIYRIQVVF